MSRVHTTSDRAEKCITSAAAVASWSPVMPLSQRPRVLVVDDQPQIRTVVRLVLETADYEIDKMEDGSHVMDRVAQWDPQLVITDLVMPDDEGLGLIGRLRHARPHLKIIAMSAARGAAYLPLARKMGADATLAKPFDPAALLAAVRLVLAMGRAA